MSLLRNLALVAAGSRLPLASGSRPGPALRTYLQHETERTRSTLVRPLKASSRLDEFFHNPQRFIDAVAAILKHALHRLLHAFAAAIAATPRQLL